MSHRIKNALKIFSPLAVWLLPVMAQAQIEANKYNFPDPLGGANIQTVISRLISAALSLVGAIFFVMFLWGGWLWMSAGGDAAKVKKATTTLTNAVIGLVIVAAAYGITSFVIDTLAKGAAKAG
jgi:hypothetical protein